MKVKNYLVFFIYSTLSIGYLHAKDNCFSEIRQEEIGCSITNILEHPTETFKIREEQPVHVKSEKKFELKITEILHSVKVEYNEEKVLIKRTKYKEIECPPFCIQPMKIKGIKTVAELEVLNFISKLKEKKSKLVIDVRESKLYQIDTIPGAINIPQNMLEDTSKYQKKILELLGAIKKGTQWSFTRVPSLLIFGESEEDDQATKAITNLLQLSYPKEKILYYRGGISSWKRLGLTVK